MVLLAAADCYEAVDRRVAGDVIAAVSQAVQTEKQENLPTEIPQLTEAQIREGWVDYANSVLGLHYSSEYEQQKSHLRRSYESLRSEARARYAPDKRDTIYHNRHEDRQAIQHAVPDTFAICSGKDRVDDALETLASNDRYVTERIHDKYLRQIDSDIRGPLGLTAQELAEEIADSLIVHMQAGKIPQIPQELALKLGLKDVAAYSNPGDFL